MFGERGGSELVSDPAWGALVRRLYDAETAGWQPARLLAAVARQRELDTADSVAEVLCWRIDGYLADRMAPPALDQPSEADARRYAALLSELPAIEPATLSVPAAVATPSVLTASDPAERHHELDPVSSILGAKIASKVHAETSWPAVQAALRRAEKAGYEPAAILAAAARTRELRTARSISEVLAWRIGRYLAAQPGPVPADTEEWRTLAWTLKAAENNGTPAQTLLRDVRHTRNLSDILVTVQHSVLQRPPPADDLTGLPPWLAGPVRHRTRTDDRLSRYQYDATALIAGRMRHVAEAAQRDKPSWMSMLGPSPAGDPRRHEWLRHIGIIAAYRDQHQVSSDDPRQVLGPYVEPGHAGYAAYWHAAESVVTARTLSGLEPATGNRRWHDPVRAQIAADIYLSLPETERSAIQSAMTGRLGPMWLGHPAELDDHTVTSGVFADCLADVLIERGHSVESGLSLLSAFALQRVDACQMTISRGQA